jgi:hypothetical protein
VNVLTATIILSVRQQEEDTLQGSTASFGQRIMLDPTAGAASDSRYDMESAFTTNFPFI